jgi:hypothetical protein
MVDRNIDIDLGSLKKLYPTKASIVEYFKKQGILSIHELGFTYPKDDAFDFAFFLQVIQNKKKVRLAKLIFSLFEVHRQVILILLILRRRSILREMI